MAGGKHMTYGCHNRPLLPPAADVFSPRCNYDQRERDTGCGGCRFRGEPDRPGRLVTAAMCRDFAAACERMGMLMQRIARG